MIVASVAHGATLASCENEAAGNPEMDPAAAGAMEATAPDTRSHEMFSVAPAAMALDTLRPRSELSR